MSNQTALHNVGHVNSSALHQPNEFEPYDPFRLLPPSDAAAAGSFNNDNARGQSPRDVIMKDETKTSQHHHEPAQDIQEQPKTSLRRSKYGNLDWDRYKEQIRELYLDDNKSLDDTMRTMEEKHSFTAS
jgi:hypothetical protein